MKRFSLVIVIPVYNSGNMFKDVLNQIFDCTYLFENVHLVVLDNNSQDNSLSIVKETLYDVDIANLTFDILQNEFNLGYGGSVIKGLTHGLGIESDWILIFHSDNQTNYEVVLRNFHDSLVNLNQKIFIFSRFTNESELYGYNKERILGNYFFKFVSNRLFNLTCSDPGAAIMAIKPNLLREIPFYNFDKTYMFHIDFNLVLFSTFKSEVVELPLKWTDASDSVHFSLIKYGIDLLRKLIYTYFSVRINKITLLEYYRR